MADFMSPEQRSAHMAKIRSENTKPELMLRRLLNGEGFRYRLHDRRLPGKPDLVFWGRRKVIFVNGCFWHGHDCPVGTRLPKTNSEFWQAKRIRNRERDEGQRQQLLASEWSYLDVWECEVIADANLLTRVKSFLQQ